MMATKPTKPTSEELLQRLPCTLAYWNPDAHRLNAMAEQGLCNMELGGYPWWKFTKKAKARALGRK